LIECSYIETSNPGDSLYRMTKRGRKGRERDGERQRERQTERQTE
jgi:hypothetical protein